MHSPSNLRKIAPRPAHLSRNPAVQTPPAGQQSVTYVPKKIDPNTPYNNPWVRQELHNAIQYLYNQVDSDPARAVAAMLEIKNSNAQIDLFYKNPRKAQASSIENLRNVWNNYCDKHKITETRYRPWNPSDPSRPGQISATKEEVVNAVRYAFECYPVSVLQEDLKASNQLLTKLKQGEEDVKQVSLVKIAGNWNNILLPKIERDYPSPTSQGHGQDAPLSLQPSFPPGGPSGQPGVARDAAAD